jgi:hypothetical protein
MAIAKLFVPTQPRGEEKAKLIQGILRFRGKEYLEQNFIVDFECNECGKTWLAPGVVNST